jgi:hypothetical protein
VLTVDADALGAATTVDPFAECAVRDVAGVVLLLLLLLCLQQLPLQQSSQS